MDRLKILEKIHRHSKKSLSLWIIGMMVVLAGLLVYFVSPIVIKSVFNVSNIDQANSSLQNKQILSAALTYLSYALMAFGTVISLIFGEVYAGYAVFESVKLKNYDKHNMYYDYSILSILCCFLLPFIFQAYFRNQVKKEIDYFKRNNPEKDQILDLMSEEEWNKADATAQTEYLNYLIKNGVIDESEYDFLMDEIKENQRNKSDDKHKNYINSDSMDYEAYNDEYLPSDDESKNDNQSEKKYYELNNDLSNVLNKYNSKNRNDLDDDIDFKEDDENIIKKIKEETSPLSQK